MNLQNILLLLFSFTWKLTNVLPFPQEIEIRSAGILPQRFEPAPVATATKQDETKTTGHVPVINLKNSISQDNSKSTKNLVNKTGPLNVHNVTVNAPSISYNNNSNNKSPDDLIQSGALLRGFYVLLGVTLLLLMYLGFRMYRVRGGIKKPNVRVRKYGILANRSDVEMIPLPLDEDDEDDTVFEVSNQHENH